MKVNERNLMERITIVAGDEFLIPRTDHDLYDALMKFYGTGNEVSAIKEER